MKYIGLLSSAASGKLGGIVASHNRGGTYFRHHAVPVQPPPGADLVRNQLQGFSSAFKNLTQAQIAGWKALALTVTLKSKLGTTNPTGQQLFVSCNKHLAAINITALLTNAPTIPSIPGLTSFTVATTSSYGYTTAITGTYTPLPSASFGIELRASSVLSAGHTFVGSRIPHPGGLQPGHRPHHRPADPVSRKVRAAPFQRHDRLRVAVHRPGLGFSARRSAPPSDSSRPR